MTSVASASRSCASAGHTGSSCAARISCRLPRVLSALVVAPPLADENCVPNCPTPTGRHASRALDAAGKVLLLAVVDHLHPGLALACAAAALRRLQRPRSTIAARQHGGECPLAAAGRTGGSIVPPCRRGSSLQQRGVWLYVQVDVPSPGGKRSSPQSLHRAYGPRPASGPCSVRRPRTFVKYKVSEPTGSLTRYGKPAWSHTRPTSRDRCP